MKEGEFNPKAGGHRRARALLVLGVLAVAAAIWWYLGNRSAADAAQIGGSGTIEAQEVSVAAEVGGRLERVAVEEGGAVRAGDPLVAIDTALVDAQQRQAQAALEVAQANLALVEKGARAEEVRQGEAALAQAVAQRDSAKKAWENAKRLRDDPQELTAKINAAQPQVTAAEARLKLLKEGARSEDIQAAEKQVAQAKNTLWAAQIDRDGICGNKVLPEYQCHAADARVAAGETAVEGAQVNLNKLKAGSRPEEVQQAEAALAQAKATLRDLVAMRDNPLTMNAQIDTAYGQYQAAEAAMQAAQARLDALKGGSTPEQVAIARAQVRQAEAALDVLRTQRDKMTVEAPIDGTVTQVIAKAGETAMPGSKLITIANLQDVTLTVYVPETKIGQVALGQPAQVTVDSFPDQTFAGEVIYISSKAEFTPRNVQTQTERANTVFAVKVKVPNPDLKLKAGMPADARLGS